jgi:hypothetical protein
MKKELFLTAAAAFFATYPGENEIHFTADGQAFFSKNNAENHGKSLRKKVSDEVEVITITRDEAAATAVESQSADTGTTLTKEDAVNNVASAKDAVEKAEAALAESSTKLQASPDNKTLVKSVESRTAKLETAKRQLEAAETALAAFETE